MKKSLDLFILLVIQIIAIYLLLLIKTSFLVYIMVLFGLPSIYLGFKFGGNLKKIVLFSFLFSIPFTFIIDYLLVLDKGWFIPATVFPFRIFNIVTIEQFFWSVIYVIYIALFYEYFLDNKFRNNREEKKLISKKMKVFSIFLFLILSIFIIFIFSFPDLLKISYSYFFLGLIAGFLPLIIFLCNFPFFLARLIKASLFFLVLSIMAEYIGLKLNHWIFPGIHYIGIFNFFGFIVPFEEVAVYFLILTPSVLSYYEFFCDDTK